MPGVCCPEAHRRGILLLLLRVVEATRLRKPAPSSPAETRTHRRVLVQVCRMRRHACPVYRSRLRSHVGVWGDDCALLVAPGRIMLTDVRLMSVPWTEVRF
eukprot:2436631-Rhodomonas_salina.1